MGHGCRQNAKSHKLFVFYVYFLVNLFLSLLTEWYASDIAQHNLIIQWILATSSRREERSNECKHENQLSELRRIIKLKVKDNKIESEIIIRFNLYINYQLKWIKNMKSSFKTLFFFLNKHICQLLFFKNQLNMSPQVQLLSRLNGALYILA